MASFIADPSGRLSAAFSGASLMISYGENWRVPSTTDEHSPANAVRCHPFTVTNQTFLLATFQTRLTNALPLTQCYYVFDTAGDDANHFDVFVVMMCRTSLMPGRECCVCGTVVALKNLARHRRRNHPSHGMKTTTTTSALPTAEPGPATPSVPATPSRPEADHSLTVSHHNQIVQATRRAVQFFSFSRVPMRTLPTVLSDYYPELSFTDCLACAAAAVEAYTFATGPWLLETLPPTDLELPTSSRSGVNTTPSASGSALLPAASVQDPHSDDDLEPPILDPPSACGSSGEVGRSLSSTHASTSMEQSVLPTTSTPAEQVRTSDSHATAPTSSASAQSFPDGTVFTELSPHPVLLEVEKGSKSDESDRYTGRYRYNLPTKFKRPAVKSKVTVNTPDAATAKSKNTNVDPNPPSKAETATAEPGADHPSTSSVDKPEPEAKSTNKKRPARETAGPHSKHQKKTRSEPVLEEMAKTIRDLQRKLDEADRWRSAPGGDRPRHHFPPRHGDRWFRR